MKRKPISTQQTESASNTNNTYAAKLKNNLSNNNENYSILEQIIQQQQTMIDKLEQDQKQTKQLLETNVQNLMIINDKLSTKCDMLFKKVLQHETTINSITTDFQKLKEEQFGNGYTNYGIEIDALNEQFNSLREEVYLIYSDQNNSPEQHND